MEMFNYQSNAYSYLNEQQIEVAVGGSADLQKTMEMIT